MLKTVTFSDLEKLACSYGYNGPFVEHAITTGLIQKTIKRDLSDPEQLPGKRYPWRSYTGLRALCCLANAGYRGKELRFILWYKGIAEWDNGIKDYLLTVIQHPPEQSKAYAFELIRREQRYIKRSASEQPTRGIRDIPAQVESDWSEAENIINLMAKLFFRDPLVKSDNQENEAELEEIRHQIADAGLSFVLGDDQTLSTNITTRIDPRFSQKYFIHILQSATVQEYRSARLLIIGERVLSPTFSENLRPVLKKWQSQYAIANQIFRYWIHELNKLWTEFDRRMTIHTRQRLGPWRHPRLAIRALFFVYTLFIVHQDLQKDMHRKQ